MEYRQGRALPRFLKANTSMPGFIDFPVKNRAGWENTRRKYDPKDSRRYPKTWGEELIDYYKAVEHAAGVHLGSCFGWARLLVGLKRLAVFFYRGA